MEKTTKSDKSDKSESRDVVRGDSWLPRRWSDLFSWPFGDRFESLGLFDEHFMRTEEFETDHTYVVRAEMPGLDPDKDVEIHVTGQTLRIEASRKEEKEAKDKGRYRSEFRYGHYVRTVALPLGVHADDVKATYKDGILEVRMPLDREKAAMTKVPVQHV